VFVETRVRKVAKLERGRERDTAQAQVVEPRSLGVSHKKPWDPISGVGRVFF